MYKVKDSRRVYGFTLSIPESAIGEQVFQKYIIPSK
jgi:hypothetical protein